MAGPFEATPLTIRASLPSVGWVNLPIHLGTLVQNVTFDSELQGGPAKCAFELPGEYPLLPGTLLALSDGSCPVWSGEIEAADPDPQSRITRVTGRGRAATMQDGIIYDKTYVIDDLSKWVDAKSSASATLSYATIVAEISSGDGVVSMGFPSGADVFNSGFGLVIDMGPNNTASRIVVEWDSTGMNGTFYPATFRARASATNALGALAANDAFVVNFAVNPGASATSAGTFPTPQRYVFLFVDYTGGVGTNTVDRFVRIKRAIVTTSTAYESGNASALKGSQVAADIVANAGIPSISTSTANIVAGTQSLQELTSNADNPRSLLDRANVADGRQWYWTPDPVPALTMRVPPTTPRWVLLPGEYQLAGGNPSSINDVYNRVVVYYQDAYGVEQIVTRTLTPDTTILARLARTRTAILRIDRVSSSAEATSAGDVFLRDNSRPPSRASIITSRGYIRTESGMRMSPRLVTQGDMIQLSGLRDIATGAIGRRGIIYAAAYDENTGTATISLDSDSTVFDRVAAAS